MATFTDLHRRTVPAALEVGGSTTTRDTLAPSFPAADVSPCTLSTTPTASPSSTPSTYLFLSRRLDLRHLPAAPHFNLPSIFLQLPDGSYRCFYRVTLRTYWIFVRLFGTLSQQIDQGKLPPFTPEQLEFALSALREAFDYLSLTYSLETILSARTAMDSRLPDDPDLLRDWITQAKPKPIPPVPDCSNDSNGPEVQSDDHGGT